MKALLAVAMTIAMLIAARRLLCPIALAGLLRMGTLCALASATTNRHKFRNQANANNLLYQLISCGTPRAENGRDKLKRWP